MFTEIYIAFQQGHVLQHQRLEEARQARWGFQPGQVLTHRWQADTAQARRWWPVFRRQASARR